VARIQGAKNMVISPRKMADLSDQHGDFTCDFHGVTFLLGQKNVDGRLEKMVG